MIWFYFLIVGGLTCAAYAKFHELWLRRITMGVGLVLGSEVHITTNTACLNDDSGLEVMVMSPVLVTKDPFEKEELEEMELPF